MSRYVIVGNGVAGTSAVEEIRKQDPKGSIDIFSIEDKPFYYRIRLPEVVAGEVQEETIVAKSPGWYKDQDISLHLETQVTEIDAENKALVTEDGQEFPYDRLLLANGSHSFIPPIQGSDKPGVFALRTMQDVREIRNWAQSSEQVVLIGGGLLGLEAGNGLRKLGKQVTVVREQMLPMCLIRSSWERLKLSELPVPEFYQSSRFPRIQPFNPLLILKESPGKRLGLPKDLFLPPFVSAFFQDITLKTLSGTFQAVPLPRGK